MGWLIFGTIPDGTSLIGMFIVAISGLIIAFKSHFTKAAPTKPESDQL